MIMIIEMMRANIYWFNAFPVKDGVSNTMGSGQITTDQIPDYDTHCLLYFGTYVQVHN